MSRHLLGSLLAILTLLLGSGAWWLWGRSPESQVLAAQTAFLRAIEKRNWEKVTEHLAADYADAYGFTQTTAPAAAAEVLKPFISLTLKAEILPVQPVSAGTSFVQARLRLEGQSLGFGSLVTAHVNAMQAPWDFYWRKEGSWPWSWKVTRVHHPELHMPAGAGGFLSQ